jgi:hypothetical protein
MGYSAQPDGVPWRLHFPAVALMPNLEREEYIEQAYLFRGLHDRLDQSDPVQEVMRHLRQEVLATTKLPMAIDFLLAELNHVGTMATAMRKLSHYFAPFQTFVMDAAEDERGKFDMQRGLLILEHEARFRAEGADRPSMFFYQFESLCRNRLDYDYGLQAMAADPIYDESWKRWILAVRHQIGMVDLADLVYVHSEHYLKRQASRGVETAVPDPLLFGEKEGRIALANRKKEPLYLFAALQRQLGYPEVPRPKPPNPADELLPKLSRTVERLEVRIKLLEDEQRERGIDLSQFYGKFGPGGQTK